MHIASVVVLVAAATLSGCGGASADREIQQAISEARRNGVAQIVKTAPSEAPVPPLREWLRDYAVVHIRGSAVTPLARREGEWVVTWLEVEHVRTLGTQSPAVSESCGSYSEPPSGLLMTPGSLAMPVRGGSVVAQGVRLLVEGPAARVRVDAGREYVVFGALCGRRLMLTQREAGIFGVDDEGRLLRDPNDSVGSPAEREVMELGTLVRMEEELRRVRRDGNPGPRP